MSDSNLLNVCPSCKQKLLLFNKNENRYECLNCKDSFFKATIDKYIQQNTTESRNIGHNASLNAKAWVGNEYYDPKTKKWRKGQKIKRISIGGRGWVWTLLVFVLVSIIVTLILNYFVPGTRYMILPW